MWSFLIFLFWLVLAIISSFETSRPLAVAAAWVIVLAALFAWGALSPPPSARGIAWSVLIALVGLGLVAAYLAHEGRPSEIAVWLPAIVAGLIGWLYLLGAFYDSRARAARGVLATVLLAVPLSLWATVGDFTGIQA